MYALRLQKVLPVALVASAGVLFGVIWGAREISQQAYLSQKLWRTAVWTLCEQTSDAAILGAKIGLLLLLVLIVPWRRVFSALQWLTGLGPATPAGATSSFPRALRLAVFVLVCSGGAALLIPEQAPPRLRLPLVVVGSFGILWLLVAALAATAPKLAEARQAEAWFRLHWLTVMGLAYLIVALHIWVLRASWPTKGWLWLGVLLACILAYHALRIPVRFLNNLVNAILARAGALPSGRLLRASGWASAVILISSGVLWGAGGLMGMQARAEARQRGRNVILISIDTMRADHASLLSADEQDRDLTPNLRKRLAARGTVFTNAISQAPWTLPSFASIFTGLYPEQHYAEGVTSKLPYDQLTLAEVLREAGYHTMSVVSNGLVGTVVRMDQGFVELDQSQRRGVQGQGFDTIVSHRVTTIARHMLKRAHRNGDPFFLFVHYNDPHASYVDHADIHFADEYTGWLREELQDPSDRHMNLLKNRRDLLGPEEHRYLRALYAEEIAYTDTHVGGLLDHLDQANLWDSTLVIFVADHGEEFYDHGWVGHTTRLYQELIHVPLVAVMPGGENPPTISRPVETRWIFGTILDFLGISAPGRGTSSPSLFDAPPVEDILVRSSTHPGPKAGGPPGTDGGRGVWLSCLLGKRWKVIQDQVSGRVMLFDLVADPTETSDQSDEMPDVRRRFEGILARWDAEVRGESSPAALPQVDEEHLRALKALGYLK